MRARPGTGGRSSWPGAHRRRAGPFPRRQDLMMDGYPVSYVPTNCRRPHQPGSRIPGVGILLLHLHRLRELHRWATPFSLATALTLALSSAVSPRSAPGISLAASEHAELSASALLSPKPTIRACAPSEHIQPWVWTCLFDQPVRLFRLRAVLPPASRGFRTSASSRVARSCFFVQSHLSFQPFPRLAKRSCSVCRGSTDRDHTMASPR